jgi:hypothetical protein
MAMLNNQRVNIFTMSFGFSLQPICFGFAPQPELEEILPWVYYGKHGRSVYL